MRMLFNSGKHETLIRMLEGASTILAQSTPQATAGEGHSSAAAAGGSSATESARSSAGDLLWCGGGVGVLQWLIVAVEQVELQYKGIALGLMLQRWVVEFHVTHTADCSHVHCVGSGL